MRLTSLIVLGTAGLLLYRWASGAAAGATSSASSGAGASSDTGASSGTSGGDTSTRGLRRSSPTGSSSSYASKPSSTSTTTSSQPASGFDAMDKVARELQDRSSQESGALGGSTGGSGSGLGSGSRSVNPGERINAENPMTKAMAGSGIHEDPFAGSSSQQGSQAASTGLGDFNRGA